MKKLCKALFLLAVFAGGNLAYAHNVGQSQTSKYFAPETVQMLLDRASGVVAGGPGIRNGDVLSYIIESVPSPNGATLGSAGYVTDYIPPGMEVVGASFVDKVPDPTKVGGFAFVDRPANAPGILGDGCGQRGCQAYLAPFANGSIARGTQDTGIFFSTDPRTQRLPQALTAVLPPLLAYPSTAQIDITACTKSKLAGGQLAFLTYNQWDFDQFIAFGDNKGACGGAAIKALTGGSGRGNPPVLSNPALPGTFVGLSSPVAGPQTYYTNDYNPLGDGNAALVSIADFQAVGPWQRIYAPGALIGGSGPVVSYLVNGPETIAGVPTSAGWQLSTANPLPPTTNAVRWAIGERTVGSVEYVKIKLRVTNLAAFSAGALNNTAYTNHSEVFGGDASGGAQGGKDVVYAYLGPSQANNNAQLMVTKKVVAVSNVGPNGPWISSDGAFVAPGQWVKYRLNYLNAASAPLYNVTITDVIDTLEAVYVSSTTGNPFVGAATYLAPNLTWPAILSLSPGGGGSMEVVVQVTAAGGGAITSNTVQATASTTAPPAAPLLINAQAIFVSNISGAGAVPNISQSKTVTPSVAAPGGQVLYSITLQNNGGAITQPAKGNNKITKGPIYPAGLGVPAVPPATGGGLIVGDQLPVLAPPAVGKAITYLNTLAVKLKDNNTGTVYPLVAGTDYVVDTLTRPGDVFWQILNYPVGFPSPVTGLPLLAGTPFDFATGTLQIDFYATVGATTTPGVYYNQAESYVGTWDQIKNKQGKDISKVTPGLAPVSVSSPDFTGFWKTDTDINGTPTGPGEIVQYNLNATNTGLVAATNVVITDAIPANTSFVVGSATAAPAGTISYSNDGGLTYLYTPVGVAGAIDPAVTHIKFTYPTVAVGASATPSFRVQVAPVLGNGTQILNQANLTSLETGLTVFKSDDPALPGLTDFTTTTITAQPDYSTSTKTALVNGVASSSIKAGDTVTYTITLHDTGNNAAGSSNINLSDAIDINVLDIATLTTTQPVGWTVAGPSATGVISWSAPSFAQGATAVFTVSGVVKAGVAQGTVLNNSVAITSTELPTPTTIQAAPLTVPQTSVSGYVYTGSLANGIANVTVALQAVGSNIDTVNTVTDANGFYLLNAPSAGAWEVRVTDVNGVLSGMALAAGFSNPLPVTLVSGQTLANQNFAYDFVGSPAVVQGRIFDDLNGDGVENTGEPPIAGVTIRLKTATGVVLATQTTNATGDYQFNNVAQGDYILEITDAAGLLVNRYLTTGLASPVTLTGLLPGSISRVNFGYRIGSRIGDFIFDDTNANGIFDVGEVGLPNVSVVLQQGGVTKYSATTDNTGTYLFQGVAPGSYNLIVTNPFTGVPNAPVLVTAVSGVDQLTFDYGFSAPPAITVSKTTANPIAGQNAAVQYTITVTNTGGAANNFVLKDILPSTTPLVVPAPTYTASAGSFLYLSTDSVLLNGAPFAIPNMPANFATQPTWSGFSMPGQSTLTITFTAFTDAIDGMYYNGVQYAYSNAVGVTVRVDNPDLATVVVSSTGTLSKAVTKVNGVPWAGGTPVVAAGDVITYTVTLQNTPAALEQRVSQFTETMPPGFSYVPNSTVIVSPVNPVAVAPAPTQVGQTLTWLMPVPNPATLAGSAISQITLSFDLLVGPTATAGTHTDIATASVVAVPVPAPVPLPLPVALSTGNTAPVTVSQPVLSMVKTTTTPVISRDTAGNYTPATFKVTLTNTGSAPANGVVLTDTLPIGFNYASGTVFINGVAQAAGTVSFNQVGQTLTVTTVPVGGFTIPAKNGVTNGTLVVEYTVNITPVTPTGVYTNSVSMASTNGGTIAGITASVELVDVQLSKTTSTPTVNPGGVVNYTISVANYGGAVINNVSVGDLLPAGFSYKAGSTIINGVASADPAGTAGTPLWTLPSIAANSTTTIAFSADVSATMTPGVYYNTVQASTGALSFPNPGPTAPVTVLEPQPSLTVLKQASSATAKPGDTITYTVTITNTGAGQANTVVVTDAMSSYTKLALAPFAPANPNMFSFIDGANPSGLPGTATVTYSNDGGATYNYTPVDDGTGHDPAITNFKLQMNGVMNANQAANPSFSVQYQVQVK